MTLNVATTTTTENGHQSMLKIEKRTFWTKCISLLKAPVYKLNINRVKMGTKLLICHVLLQYLSSFSISVLVLYVHFPVQSVKFGPT